MTTDERFDEWNKTPFTQEQLRQLMNDTYEEDIMRASYRAGAREALEEVKKQVEAQISKCLEDDVDPHLWRTILKLIEESQK